MKTVLGREEESRKTALKTKEHDQNLEELKGLDHGDRTEFPRKQVSKSPNRNGKKVYKTYKLTSIDSPS